MGSIEFEGWNIVIDDIQKLNNSTEIHRLGLVFEQFADLVSASAQGNVSAYYVILKEIRERLVSGSFNGTVKLSTGEEKTIILSTSFVTENGEDITDFIGK